MPQLVAAALPALITAAIVATVSVVAQKFLAPEQPAIRPSDGRANVRRQIGPRVRYYGKARAGGQLVFFESDDGVLHEVIVYNHGEIESFDAFYLNDLEVTLDGSGYVTDSEYKVGSTNLVQIDTRPGTTTQTAFSAITTAFPSLWSSSHQLKGLACAYVTFTDTRIQDQHRVYPRGQPALSVVMSGYNQIEDPRDSSTGWTDNASLIIRDFLINADGMNIDSSLIDDASFEDFADVCDESVTLGAGGSEARYRIWLGYSLEEEPQRVLGAMLAACDASLYQTAAGKVAIRGGEYATPTVTLDADEGHILAADLHRGADALAKYNTLRFTYTDPGLDYLEQEGDPWVDSGLLTANGGVTETQSLDLIACPSHSQARRLAKIRIAKDNPDWIGQLRCNLAALDAWTEEYITVKIPELLIDGPFRVVGIRVLGDGTGVVLDVHSMDPAAYNWTTAEEGAPPEGSATVNPLTPPAAPTGVAADAVQRVVNGSTTGTVISVSWTAPSRASLAHEVQFQPSGADTWQTFPVVPAGTASADSPLIDAGVDYDVRVRAISPQGVVGEWSATVSTASGDVDTGAPGVPTSVSATGFDDLYQVSYTLPSDSNTAGGRVWDSTTNDFATASVRRTFTGSPSTAYVKAIPRAVGTYYVWVTAYNASGVDGTEVYAGSVTVTTPGA